MKRPDELSHEGLVNALVNAASEAGTSTSGLVVDIMADAKLKRMQDLKKEVFRRLMSEVKPYTDEGDVRQLMRPEDVDLSEGLSSTFGKVEVERAAENLVRFFQSRGAWCPFTKEELLAFYRTQLPDEDPEKVFFGLFGGWFDDGALTGGWKIAPQLVVRYPDERYRITNLFMEAIKNHIRKGALV